MHFLKRIHQLRPAIIPQLFRSHRVVWLATEICLGRIILMLNAEVTTWFWYSDLSVNAWFGKTFVWVFSVLKRYHLKTQVTVDKNSNWCWECGKERAWLISRDVLQLKFDKLLSFFHKQIHTTKQLQATNYIILHDLLSGFLPGRKWLGQILLVLSQLTSQ